MEAKHCCCVGKPYFTRSPLFYFAVWRMDPELHAEFFLFHSCPFFPPNASLELPMVAFSRLTLISKIDWCFFVSVCSSENIPHSPGRVNFIETGLCTCHYMACMLTYLTIASLCFLTVIKLDTLWIILSKQISIFF